LVSVRKKKQVAVLAEGIVRSFSTEKDLSIGPSVCLLDQANKYGLQAIWG